MNNSDNSPPLPNGGHASPRLPYHERLCAMYARNMATMNQHLREAFMHKIFRVQFPAHGEEWYVNAYSSERLHDEYGHSLDYLNVVEYGNFSQDAMPFDISIIASLYQSAQCPLSWTVGPLENPLLEGTLLSLGFTKEEDQAAMFCDLDTFRRETLSDVDLWALHNQLAINGLCANVDRLSRMHLNRCEEALGPRPWTCPHLQAVAETRLNDLNVINSLMITPLLSTHMQKYIIETIRLIDVTEWVRIWTNSATRTLPIVLSWETTFVYILRKLEPTQFRMFAAKIRKPGSEDRQPIVGIGLIHCADGVAVIQHVKVIPGHTGQGLEYELVHYAVRIALHNKYLRAIAVVDKGTRAAFRRAGFRDISRVKKYVLRPEPPPTGP
ncbi:hypothetical protein GGR58DRAFT_500979 [Xylaria digitata]|nr:hypothetical protein GGR58DRAFT_500979 [Xylaria digitata]